MTGLIPLLLNPAASGNRSSVVFCPSPTFPSHRRISVLSSAPTPPPPQPIPRSVPAKSAMKSSKRLSQPLPSVLPVLPYTSADWRRTIAEIKRQHVNRRYRACFTRCSEILDNVKDTSHVEPAYLIYLHFYAATSMEMCVRPLLATSPYRAQLLQQARTHYDRAASLIQKAEDSVAAKTRPSSVTSTASSIHSPAGSVSSRAWTSETGMSSPTQSICSLDDLVLRSSLSSSSSSSSSQSTPSPSTPTKKKVSFSLPPSTLKTEPFIRPDSPTLGFDDEYFTAALSRPPLPKLPQQTFATATEENLEAGLEEEEEEEEETTPRASSRASSTRFDDDHDHLGDSLLLAGSVHRYCDHLSGLKAQIATFSADLDSLLQGPSSLSVMDAAAADVRPATPTSDELRNLDRQVRIERLRKSGWQRKRFNPRRYEDLCNTVIAEMA